MFELSSITDFFFHQVREILVLASNLAIQLLVFLVHVTSDSTVQLNFLYQLFGLLYTRFNSRDTPLYSYLLTLSNLIIQSLHLCLHMLYLLFSTLQPINTIISIILYLDINLQIINFLLNIQIMLLVQIMQFIQELPIYHELAFSIQGI